MFVFNKSFFIGLAVGVALATVGLDLWAVYVERRIFSQAQVHLLRPLESYRPSRMPKSSERLPRPWFPQLSGSRHDSWRLRGLDGKAIKLADLKGDVVFLNFWLTTCAPCIAEMPGIENLSRSLKGERVVFLAVTPEEDRRVLEFLKKVPLQIPIYLSNGAQPDDLQANGYPSTFILDPSGSAVFRLEGPANWDNDDARIFLSGLATGRKRDKPM